MASKNVLQGNYNTLPAMCWACISWKLDSKDKHWLINCIVDSFPFVRLLPSDFVHRLCKENYILYDILYDIIYYI